MKRIARTAAPIIAAVALLAAVSGSALAVSKTAVPYQTTQPVPLALAGDQVAFKHIEPVPAPRI